MERKKKESRYLRLKGINANRDVIEMITPDATVIFEKSILRGTKFLIENETSEIGFPGKFMTCNSQLRENIVRVKGDRCNQRPLSISLEQISTKIAGQKWEFR